MKKVSIIIPFYHGNKFIKNIAEMLEKNYHNLDSYDDYTMEAVIVKDSLDDEIELNTKNYSVPIKIVKNDENIGLHRARINGINNCTGDYIVLLDQDDIIEDDYVLKQLNKIGDNDVVLANGYLYWKDTGEKKVIYKSVEQQKRTYDLRICGQISTVISPCLFMVKKSAIPKMWLEKPIINTGCDDAYLWNLLIINNAKFTVHDEKIYYHVYTGNNATNNTERMCKSIYEMNEHLKGLLPKKYIRRNKRFADYYIKPNRKLSKLLYLDVILSRKYYRKKFNK